MMNKRILVSLMVIGFIGAGVTGTTLALFSDTEASEDNQFETGTLDLLVDWEETYNGELIETQELTNDPGTIFELEDIKPGDEGQATVSLHLEDNPGWIWMKLNQTANENVVCPEPQQEALGVDSAEECGEEGNLADYLEFTIYSTDASGELENEDDIIFQGTATELEEEQLSEDGLLLDGDKDMEGTQAFEGGETGYVAVQWNLPLETGNIVQGDLKMYDIEFYTEQERHNPQDEEEQVVEEPLEDENETVEKDPVEDENDTVVEDPVEDENGKEDDAVVEDPVEDDKGKDNDTVTEDPVEDENVTAEELAQFEADIEPLNEDFGSEAMGDATLTLSAPDADTRELHVNMDVTDLEDVSDISGAVHVAHIHGQFEGNADRPLSEQGNGEFFEGEGGEPVDSVLPVQEDGNLNVDEVEQGLADELFLDFFEGRPAYGPVVMSLSSEQLESPPSGTPPLTKFFVDAGAGDISPGELFPNDSEFHLNTSYTFNLSDSDERRQYNNLVGEDGNQLDKREIVVHGQTLPTDISDAIDEATNASPGDPTAGIKVEGTNDSFRATAPVAAGEIEEVSNETEEVADEETDDTITVDPDEFECIVQ